MRGRLSFFWHDRACAGDTAPEATQSASSPRQAGHIPSVISSGWHVSGVGSFCVFRPPSPSPRVLCFGACRACVSASVGAVAVKNLGPTPFQCRLQRVVGSAFRASVARVLNIRRRHLENRTSARRDAAVSPWSGVVCATGEKCATPGRCPRSDRHRRREGGHYFVVLLLEFAAFTRGRNSECGGVERVGGEVFTVFVECRGGGGTRNSAQTKCHNEGIYFKKLIMSHLDQALNLQYTKCFT